VGPSRRVYQRAVGRVKVAVRGQVLGLEEEGRNATDEAGREQQNSGGRWERELRGPEWELRGPEWDETAGGWVGSGAAAAEEEEGVGRRDGRCGCRQED